MKTFISLLLTCLGVSAATPSFSSFNANQFSTNNLFISIKDGAVITNLNVITDLFINSTNIVNLFAPSSVTNSGGDSLWFDVASIATLTNTMEGIEFGHDVSTGDDPSISFELFATEDGAFLSFSDIYMVVNTNSTQIGLTTDVSGVITSALYLNSGDGTGFIQLQTSGNTDFYVANGSGYTGGGTLFLSDDGTYKAAGGVGGDSIWTNITGYVTMIPGQTATNTLAFVSGAADNATNIALRVGTASNWNGASKLISLETQNTNVFSVNTLATVTLNGRTGQANFLGQMDSGAYWELWADDFDRYFAMSTADGNDVLTYLAPTVASSGSAVAYLLGTSNTLTNGDKFVSIVNAGTEVLNISPNSTGAQIVFGPGSTNVLKRDVSFLVYTNGATSTSMGLQIVKGDGTDGKLQMTTGSHLILLAGTGSDLFLAANNNGSGDYRVVSTAFSPVTNGDKDLGSTTTQWNNIHLDNRIVWNGSTNTIFDTWGVGDPNGAVTADIGSTYRRADGGAATSFYVKESNNGGNTGWVSK